MDFNSKTKEVEDKVKSILNTVLERCKKESDSSALQLPLDEYVQRASYYTAFPITYVNSLVDIEKEKKQTKSQCFTIQQLINILECLRKLYEIKMLPTYQVIYDTVENRAIMPNFEVYKQQMHTMGYRYRRVKSGLLLVEDPKFRFKRFRYLNSIRKLRGKKENICYIDARIINKEMNFERYYASAMKEAPPYDEYVLLHAIHKYGCINYLFTNNMTNTMFIKWLSDILMPTLDIGSTIVVENCIFEKSLTNKSINRFDTKNEMIKWLKSNNIPCDKNMPKADLYDLICKSKVRSKHKIEQIANAYGHDILCLPFEFDNLTPAHLMWEYLKKKISCPPEVPLANIRNKVEQSIKLLDKSVFSNFNRDIEEKENQIFKLDIEIEDLLDTNYEFIIEDIIDDIHIPESYML